MAFLSLGFSFSRAATPAAPVPIWPATAAGAAKSAVQPFLPAAGKHTGGAVLIVAAADGPASDVAPLAGWLSERGIAAFVLKLSLAGNDPAPAAGETVRALQYLRARAADFKISPKRIALLGYARGAVVAGEAAYNRVLDAKADATDPIERVSSRPDLVALIWGATTTLPSGTDLKFPPTFLVGSTKTEDNLSPMIELWNKLRAVRSSVDAHFFAQADLKTVLAQDNESIGTWPEMFYNWSRVSGLLTDEPRLPIKGMVYLDGAPIPHGYVILTPVDFVGAGPIVGRVFNSTANEPMGYFSVIARLGPIAGRYKVDVRQNMNRWLSNGFTGGLTGGRGGQVTPEQAHFGHHRLLNPTIDDQKSFTKVRPSDRTDYIVEIKPDPAANLDLKIEVFSK